MNTRYGADDRTWTCMKSLSHGPEPCASANSATSAYGGERWIRTIEVRDGRFTVCSLWPLGNLSIWLGYYSTVLKNVQAFLTEKWSWWWDSNPQPADYKSAALPIELHQHKASFPVALKIIYKTVRFVNYFLRMAYWGVLLFIVAH